MTDPTTPAPASGGLLPCPFCNSTAIDCHEACGEIWRACSECHASTAMQGTDRAAHEAWNRRPILAFCPPRPDQPDDAAMRPMYDALIPFSQYDPATGMNWVALEDNDHEAVGAAIRAREASRPAPSAMQAQSDEDIALEMATSYRCEAENRAGASREDLLAKAGWLEEIADRAQYYRSAIVNPTPSADADNLTPESRASIERGMQQSRDGKVVVRDFSQYAHDDLDGFTPRNGDGTLVRYDYDALERMHKQDGWNADQKDHYEAGFEAGYEASRPVPAAPGGVIDPDDERPISEFQDDVRAALIEGLTALGVKNAHQIDGGGCDSGDWRDFTLAEINQAFVILSDRQYDAKKALATPPAPPAHLTENP